MKYNPEIKNLAWYRHMRLELEKVTWGMQMDRGMSFLEIKAEFLNRTICRDPNSVFYNTSFSVITLDFSK